MWMFCCKNQIITLDEETLFIKICSQICNIFEILGKQYTSGDKTCDKKPRMGRELQGEEAQKSHWVTSVYGESTTTAYEHETEENAFKVNVFYAALDTLIQEINSRFLAMNEMFSFIWKFINFLLMRKE